MAVRQYGQIIATKGGGGSGGINYSTEEQDTGLTWIDGKKIYQKTVVYDGVIPYVNGGYEVAHNITDLNEVISWEGSLYDPGDVERRPFRPLPITDLSNPLGVGGIGYTYIYVVIGSGYGSNRLCKLKVTLRYTKTTD